MSMTYNGSVYYYVTNLQGDVIIILDSEGAAVASYTYDAWGNPTSISSGSGIAALNPLRYRGYVYDKESGLYYLQSRYYDPTMGRFINADAFASTGQDILGCNMFAYCNNNPIMYIDRLGTVPSPWDYEWKNPTSMLAVNGQSDLSGTFSVGLAAFGSPQFWAYGTQLCISTDMYGNTEIQWTGEAGLTTGSGWSFMPYIMVTNAPHVSNLRGFGVAVGGVLPTKPVAINVDFNIIPDDARNTAYTGVTIAAGLGSGEGHVMMGCTVGKKAQFNLLHILNNVYTALLYE